MDKLKVFFGQLKRHHFWVLSGFVLILSLTGWYLAASALSEEYTQNRNKIKSKFDDLNKIVSVVNHPNEKFEHGTKQLTRTLKKDVEKAWNLVYADQRDNVLKWPDELGEDFLQTMDALEPTDEIPVELRERYLNYVKKEFPRLLKIVDARPYWDRSDDDSVGTGGRMRRPMGLTAKRRASMEVDEKKEYRVKWDPKDQELVDALLDWPRTPTSQEVRFCQENLWVYHALLEAIAKVNEGSTGHHNAKIKEIIQLSIGKEAAAALQEALANGRIISGDGPAGQAGFPGSPMGGAMGGEGMMMPQAMPSGAEMLQPGAEGGMGKGMVIKLDDKRYVDDKGIPMRSGAAGPPEFKRMPVMLRLTMDQRDTAALLVELANSKLPVEIRQLRFNTKMPGVAKIKEVMFGGGGDQDANSLRKGPAKLHQNRQQDEQTQYPYDLPIEMHGFIFIFNAPDKKVFAESISTDGEATAPTDAVLTPTTTESEVVTEKPTTDAAVDRDAKSSNGDTPATTVEPTEVEGDPPARAAVPKDEAAAPPRDVPRKAAEPE